MAAPPPPFPPFPPFQQQQQPPRPSPRLQAAPTGGVAEGAAAVTPGAEGAAAVSPGTAHVTLLVRHLPEAIPQEMLSRLFSYYGAASVRPCAGGRLRNCAFVDFANEPLASQAQSQLNRLRFLGKVLVVERAEKAISDNKNKKSEVQSANLPIQAAPPLKDVPVAGDLMNRAVTSSVFGSEPIAARLGVDYSFPPHLKYEYPPPDGNILTNIVNALIAVPRFYTQVLHLMNKMNIPAPFRMALPTPPLPAPAPPPPPPPPPISAKSHLADLSSDESELESSEEDVADAVPSRKRAKREAILGPAVDKGVAHEDVGLKPATLVPKEVPMIKKKNPILQIKITPKTTQNECTDDDGGKQVPIKTDEDHSKQKNYATPEEIEGGKLSLEELLSLPMFKNYNAGNPATVLYIKNLAKDVVVDDFYYIFGSLFGSVEAAKSGLGVKLMQEGRMRGQAFLTFPSADLAQHALNLVNRFVYKGKPMIIQFGRSPGAGKSD